MRGLIVEAGGRTCVVPAANVERAVRIPAADIRTVENRETVCIDGQAVSLVRLGDLLEIPGGAGGSPVEQRPVVVLSAAEKRIAFAVDQILEVQEVLAKPLGPQLSRVRNVAGATVLGNGTVVPILNINDLMRSAVTVSAAAVAAPPPGVRPAARRVSVLVAEDSITSRTLLKTILEGAGFQVRTAVDGIDALSSLKVEEFDIVVSDVEMPRMDGFELTAAIRRDQRYADLPVVLVTGLESREDRERGVDVGANAYIVKSSFDQSRLVEIIRKLT
jgi:two-component system chemotaxis sensor kinase CheA